MFKTKLTEETRVGIILVMGLFVLLLLMFLLNFFLGGSEKAAVVEKEKVKTVIVTEAKENVSLQKPLPKSVVSTVRDALKKGNYSTAYMEINKVSKTSPEYEELRKQLAEETERRKAPGVRKEKGSSPTAPIRYLDESAPRNRDSDAIYMYFVDISGALWPRFCIQVSAKRPLGITGFIITTDNKNIEIVASSVKFERTDKGVAEWYDAPLDRSGYEAVQAIIRAKKSTLTITGNSGKRSRDVTESEKKGLRNIINGYAALGGNFNYMQTSKPIPAAPRTKRQ